MSCPALNAGPCVAINQGWAGPHQPEHLSESVQSLDATPGWWVTGWQPHYDTTDHQLPSDALNSALLTVKKEGPGSMSAYSPITPGVV